MTHTLDLIIRIAESTSVRQAWDLASAHFRECGFVHANYGQTRFLNDNCIGNPADALYLTTSEAGYSTFLLRDHFYMRTPLYRWAMTHVGHCNWRWVEDDFLAGRLSAPEAAAVSQNREIGVVAGVTIAFPIQSPRMRSAMGLRPEDAIDHDGVDVLWELHGKSILAIAHVMNLALQTLPLSRRVRMLTERQREALEWVADGKTMQDTALLMGISPAMVEKHLRLARESLEADTTAQAIAKATLLRLIFSAPEEETVLSGVAR